MVHSHHPQDPWTAEHHRETTRGCESQLDRCHPMWEEKNHVWGQNLGLGGMNLPRGSHGADVVPSLYKNIILLALYACCSSQEDGVLVTLVHVTSNKKLCSLTLTASGLYVLLYEHNTCVGDGGQSTCVLDGNGSFSLVCFLMTKL